MNKFFYTLFILVWTLTANAQSLVFVENKGQWDEPFLFRTYGMQTELFVEKSGFTVLVGDEENNKILHEAKKGKLEGTQSLRFHSYKMRWLDANPEPKVSGDKPEPFYMNFFLGKDKSKWRQGVHPVRAIDIQAVYPGVDVRVASSNANPKVDYIVGAGADPSQIKVQYNGLDGIEIKNGRLILKTSVGIVEELEPYAYQDVQGERVEIECVYQLINNNTAGFVFPKGYDKNLELIIDPEVEFASLTGSIPDNWGFTATYDPEGNLYGGGIINGMSYPVSEGAFQITFAGGTVGSVMPCDIGISKFSSDGSSLLYSTYIGGAQNDYPHSMIVDSEGNLYISGKTSSSDFPTTTGSYDPTHNGAFDIFVLKLNANGTDLLASTYIGGSGNDGLNVDDDFSGVTTSLKYNYGDNARSEILLDQLENVYVAAASQSTNFPVTATAVKTTLSGTQDGVVFKLNNNLSSLMWSTYLGGSSDDAAYVLAFNSDKSIFYVAGGTQSTDFMSSYMSGGYWSTFQGGSADGFICKFQNSGSYPLLTATHIGTDEYDQVYGIQVDKDDDVYVMGQTLGDFPVTSGTYSVANSRQFLMKLGPDLDVNIYSTVWGKGATPMPNIVPVAFLVDTCEHVYISGWGGTIAGGSMTDMPITSDAFQPTTDGNDFYFIVFQEDATELLYATYFGSPTKMEHVDGGTSRFNPNGEVYQAICASCGPGSSSFPATSGAWSATKGSTTTNCNLGVVKIAFNLGNVIAHAVPLPSDRGCPPFEVTFNNLSLNANNYFWNFGDGATSTDESPTHIYTEEGVYTVMLIAENENGCIPIDTAYITITVTMADIEADFEYEIIDSCYDFSVDFTNTSTSYSGTPFLTSSFVWVFGDGSTFEGPTPPTHNFPGPGTYTVTLIMHDPDACTSPDSIQKTITFELFNVEADFPGGDYCVENSVVEFTNLSENGTSYHWDFGDGASSGDDSPSHTFPGTGSYTVTLFAFNPESCNKEDTVVRVINIYPQPTANFVYTPIIPEVNQPTSFVNTSEGASSYHWDFGDGTSSTETSPTKQYHATGSYNVCLIATNQYDCRDTICKTIEAEVRPLLDIPTAFTPNGDGSNDILFPRGFSVATMRLEIYNRWGELVFESESMSQGWDGTYKGVAQPMDSYAYILTATFMDGTNYSKKGNVTLIR